MLEEGKLLLLTAEEVRLVLMGHQEPPSRVSAGDEVVVGWTHSRPLGEPG